MHECDCPTLLTISALFWAWCSGQEAALLDCEEEDSTEAEESLIVSDLFKKPPVNLYNYNGICTINKHRQSG